MKVVDCLSNFNPANQICNDCGTNIKEYHMNGCGLKKIDFKYASVDLETTGLIATGNQILQIGVVLDDLVRPVDMLPKLELLVLQKDEYYGGNAFALSMNHELLKKISSIHDSLRKQKALPLNTFCFEDDLPSILEKWFLSYGWDGKTGITFAGKNFATFDWHFLAEAGVFEKVPPKHRVLDVGSLYWNPETDSEIPNSKTCMERAGLKGEVAHTALEDALMVVRMIRNHYHKEYNPNKVLSGKVRQG